MTEISKQEENDVLIMTIKGDIDASSSIALDQEMEQLMEDGYKQILIDLSELHYISSAGLGVFMSYIEDFKQSGVRMVLYGMSDKISNVFQLLGLDQFLSIAPTKENALVALNEE